MSEPGADPAAPVASAGAGDGAIGVGDAGPAGPAAPAAASGLADGRWHRLHPASPLLRGGLVFIAVAGFVIANLRERLLDLAIAFFGGTPDRPDPETDFEQYERWAEDPITGIIVNGLVGWALLGVLLVVLLVIGGYALAWRLHSFRVTADAVEVRSGILFRSHRSARLDRIQAVNLARPLFARLFGAAKLEVAVAGQDGNVQLAYLGSAAAEGLRRELLRMSGGARRRAGAGADGVAEPAAPGTASMREVLAGRVDEFLAPELDPHLAPPESVVHLPLGRVVASTVLTSPTVMLVVFVGLVVWGAVAGTPWLLFSFLPAALALVGYYWNRIGKSLRYTIAGTADGVRVGHGLLSTSSQTLPPGRIHAVSVSQPLFWRPFGWYTVQIDFAGQSLRMGDAAQQTAVLPVGTLDDVRRVVALLLPHAAAELDGLVVPGSSGRAGGDGFSDGPRSARWIRPFSWRRTGWALTPEAVLLRRGVLSRRLAIVPLARMQSVSIGRGPVRRALGLASLHVHTVTGPVTALLPVVGLASGSALFERLATDAVTAAARDRSHAWATPEAGR